MGTHSGVEGSVKFNSGVVAEITSFKVNEEGRTTDDSNINDVWDTHIPTTKAWTAEVTCWWDETDTGGQIVGAIGAALALVLGPEGLTTGDYAASGNGTVIGRGVEVSRGQTISCTFQIQGNGALTWAAL